MSEGFCRTCGQSFTSHSDRFCSAQASAALERGRESPQTAYDRAQDIIMGEVRAAHSRVADAHNRINELTTRFDASVELKSNVVHNFADVHAALTGRLDAALRRIEALELEVARLKGPRDYTPYVVPVPSYNCGPFKVPLATPPFVERIRSCSLAGQHGPNPDGSERTCPECKCISGVGTPLPDEGT